ncbi:transposase of ISCARN10, IS200/IS605 family IS200 group [Candidatus Vecturithrix granuli]|uniref:Transposase of ISCARN10, IS200/IS605 family IS200 group n=1 Tax=Vecturithrix granuli TaxID=1499967 RepID=A0A081C0R0_VECG1|nr:transposase of ISCARN10, IS200/IS605 family IS200 group [Candidatus Vecturithrix granuli]
MNELKSLAHTKWNCQYHVIFVPKYRRKVLYHNIRKYLGDVFRELATHKESHIEEGKLCSDHVHMLIAIPPKYAVSSVIGYIKGKSAIHIARHYQGCQRNYTGKHFWARGFYVDTVGLNEEIIREYIRNQEEEDKRLDQLEMFEEKRQHHPGQGGQESEE